MNTPPRSHNSMSRLTILTARPNKKRENQLLCFMARLGRVGLLGVLLATFWVGCGPDSGTGDNTNTQNGDASVAQDAADDASVVNDAGYWPDSTPIDSGNPYQLDSGRGYGWLSA